MTNLNMLETFRTKEELLNYFEAIGQNITEEEIEALKQNYAKAQENGNTLTLQQLEGIAGGVLVVIKFDPFSMHNCGHKVIDHKNPETISVIDKRFQQGNPLYERREMSAEQFLKEYSALARQITTEECKNSGHDTIFDRINELMRQPLKVDLQRNGGFKEFTESTFVNGHRLNQIYPEFQRLYENKSREVQKLLNVAAGCVKTVNIRAPFCDVDYHVFSSPDGHIFFNQYNQSYCDMLTKMYECFYHTYNLAGKSYISNRDLTIKARRDLSTIMDNIEGLDGIVYSSAYHITSFFMAAPIPISRTEDYNKIFGSLGTIYTLTNGTFEVDLPEFKVTKKDVDKGKKETFNSTNDDHSPFEVLRSHIDFRDIFGKLIDDFQAAIKEVLDLAPASTTPTSDLTVSSQQNLLAAVPEQELKMTEVHYDCLLADQGSSTLCIDRDGNRYNLPYPRSRIINIRIPESTHICDFTIKSWFSWFGDKRYLVDSKGTMFEVKGEIPVNRYASTKIYSILNLTNKTEYYYHSEGFVFTLTPGSTINMVIKDRALIIKTPGDSSTLIVDYNGEICSFEIIREISNEYCDIDKHDIDKYFQKYYVVKDKEGNKKLVNIYQAKWSKYCLHLHIYEKINRSIIENLSKELIYKGFIKKVGELEDLLKPGKLELKPQVLTVTTTTTTTSAAAAIPTDGKL